MRCLIVFTMLGSGFSYCQAQTPAPPGKLANLRLETTLVPSPAVVDVLLPPGYEQFSEPVPLFIWLHGGTSGKDYLGNRMQPFIEKAWARTSCEPAVLVQRILSSRVYTDSSTIVATNDGVPRDL